MFKLTYLIEESLLVHFEIFESFKELVDFALNIPEKNIIEITKNDN
jgi:hypothetical protein